jgi:hypothetical protein
VLIPRPKTKHTIDLVEVLIFDNPSLVEGSWANLGKAMVPFPLPFT